MPWMNAISFGVNALGHALNRTGGRKSVKATLADTSFIDDEIETIRSRNDQVTDKMMRGAGAGAGFAEITSQRTNNAFGVGQANSMLDNARIQGFEGAANKGLQNEQNSLQAITSLTGMRANLEQFNAQAQNNATATNFQAQRSDVNNIFGAAQAGIMSYAGQRRDDKRFGQINTMNEKMMNQNKSMWEAYLANLNQPKVGVPA